MVQNIQMDEATMAALRVLQSQALRRGEALGPYLQSLAARAEVNSPSVPPEGSPDDRGTNGHDRARFAGPPMTAEEFERALDELTAETPEETPVLPPGFSRADIYEDHD